ncbi:WD40 repeat-like protein [Pholiota conissans]|uniref:WD40 repeat-like protein n=1 Tax=Pholiota conissans TaxID=109636 RepID=A0A9P5YTU1_9AGAR|nr:WD40 repeat-like protein [Pholiota conissans]
MSQSSARAGSTARKHSRSNLAQERMQPEIIDVDEEHARKYEVDSDEVVPIDVETFRQNVRESREKETRCLGKRLNRNGAGMRHVKAQNQQSSGLLAALGVNTNFLNQNVDQRQANDRHSQAVIDVLARIGATAVAANFPTLINTATIPTVADVNRALSMVPRQHNMSTSAPNKRRKVDTTSSSVRVARSSGGNASSSHTVLQIAGTSESHRSVARHKRKHIETDTSDMDELDVISLSESEPDSSEFIRKRMKLSSITTSHQPSVRPQMYAKRLHEVVELPSDDELDVTSRPKKKPNLAPAHVNVPAPLENSPTLSVADDFEYNEIMDPIDLFIPSPDIGQRSEPEPLDGSGGDDDDDDDDDDWIPLGLELDDPCTWKPLKPSLNSILDDNLALTLEQLEIADSKPEAVTPNARHIPLNTSKFDPRPQQRKYIDEPVYIWDMLAQAVNLRLPLRPRPAAYQTARPHMPLWREDFDLYRLKRAFYDPSGFYELKKAPGSINRIVQNGNWTVIASGCLGGLPDSEDEVPSPYNRAGSLMTLRHKLDIPKGHEAVKLHPSRTKYYAVNDVQFHPLKKVFVSTGADCRLRVWSLRGDDSDEEDRTSPLSPESPRSELKWINKKTHKQYKNVPHDLAFKPHSSILAVAEKLVRLHSLSTMIPETISSFSLHPIDAPHIVGAMAWGAESTSNHLFASSEPLDPTDFTGAHKAYDIQNKKIMYALNAMEAGDNICVGPTGTNLALSTRGAQNRHILRLYDIARQDPKATSTVYLEPFPVRYPGFEGEVNNSTISPDGLFLALARSDNQTHVYDMRFTYRGPLYRYEHTGECQASDKRSLYGVVKAQWIQSTRSHRLALVTGGEDGCVRVWDPNLSAVDPKNGVAIAQVNSDIGHFSLGDPFAGEHGLVVGDCSGEISVFDNTI